MNLYDIRINDIKGQPLDFSQFAGKKVLLVNTASACGLTPQYAQLQELYANHADQVEVIGLPCNDFAGQEPGTPEEIVSFCNLNYNVTFPLTEKVAIKGEHPHPIYQWLTSQAQNGHSDSEVKWNFQKYLIDEKGNLQAVFAPTTEVFSDEVLSAIGISL